MIMENKYDPVPHHADEDTADGILKAPAVSATAGKLQTLLGFVATHPVTRYLLRKKWDLSERFFHRRIYGIGVFRHWLAKHHITYGQLILLLPLLICGTASTYLTLAHKNTAQTGNWAFYAVFYTFLLAQKQASVFQLLGMSWEHLIHLHYAGSVTAAILATMHAYVAYTGHDYHPCREPGDVSLQNTVMPLCRDSAEQRGLSELRLPENPRFRHSMIGTDPDLWKFLWDGGRNVSGSWMLSCLWFMLIVSAFRWTLRQLCFDIWLAAHIAASGIIVAYSGKHRVKLFVVLVIWWAIDGLLRYGWGTLFRLPKTATLTVLTWRRKSSNEEDSNKSYIVELSFDGTFHYTAGQYVRIAVLDTGQPIMFHPVSISSAPYENRVKVHFRPLGGWTNQLRKIGTNNKIESSKGNGSTTVHILLEGPYGSLSMNLWEDSFRYPVIVLVAGGIGVTPISSIVRQLLFEHKDAGRKRKIIRVIWAVKDMSLVDTLPLLGEDVLEHSEISRRVMVDPLRQLQRNKGRDGLVRDHPKPLYNNEYGDPLADDDLQGSVTTALFEANIYVTRQNDDKEGVSINLNDCNSFSEHYVHRSNDRKSGKIGEIELAKIVPDPDLDNPPPIQSSLLHHAKAESAYHNDKCFSFFAGRPDVNAILKKTASSNFIRNEQRIAVIACGPQSLVQDTKLACAQLNGPVHLDFHEEIFVL